MITAAALLELRQGSAERGRGILEGVLRNYPKRLDLWSLYIDQEIKLGDVERTRALLERATSLQLGARKMKFLFKRWACLWGCVWDGRASGVVDMALCVPSNITMGQIRSFESVKLNFNL